MGRNTHPFGEDGRTDPPKGCTLKGAQKLGVLRNLKRNDLVVFQANKDTPDLELGFIAQALAKLEAKCQATFILLKHNVNPVDMTSSQRAVRRQEAHIKKLRAEVDKQRRAIEGYRDQIQVQDVRIQALIVEDIQRIENPPNNVEIQCVDCGRGMVTSPDNKDRALCTSCFIRRNG